MIPLWAVAGVGAVVAAFVWSRRHNNGRSSVALAHTLRLASTERFQVLRRRHLWATALRAVGALLVLVGVIGVTSRPTSSTEIPSENKSRDVLLCLDVSGSMDEANVEILETFAELTRSLDGDRIGLVIFDAVAVPKFPLTNDQDFVLEELNKGAEAISEFDFEWLLATLPLSSTSSSLLADGLASCTQRFDQPEEDRPRSIIYATDNAPQGSQLFTLEEAFDLAINAGIRVYGINPYEFAESFEDLAESTGGQYWQFDDVDLVDEIVSDILSQEAERINNEPPEVIVDDEPQKWIAVSAIGVIALVAFGKRRAA